MALTIIWCGLWGCISFANVAAGLLVSLAVTTAGLSTSYRGGVHLVPLAKFCWLVLVDLVRSTVSVGAEILTPTDRTNESIVAVQVPIASREHLLLLVATITLTPGTAVVDADPDNATLYLHLLHDNHRAATVAHVERLADLANAALPVRFPTEART